MILRPETIVRWHRKGFRALVQHWDGRSLLGLFEHRPPPKTRGSAQGLVLGPRVTAAFFLQPLKQIQFCSASCGGDLNPAERALGRIDQFANRPDPISNSKRLRWRAAFVMREGRKFANV